MQGGYHIAPFLCRVQVDPDLMAQFDTLQRQLAWADQTVNLQSCEHDGSLFFRVRLQQYSGSTYAGYSSGSPFPLPRDKATHNGGKTDPPVPTKRRVFFLRHWIRRVSDEEIARETPRENTLKHMAIAFKGEYLIIRVDIDRDLELSDTFNSVSFAAWMFQVAQVDAMIEGLRNVRVAFAIERTVTHEERDRILAQHPHATGTRSQRLSTSSRGRPQLQKQSERNIESKTSTASGPSKDTSVIQSSGSVPKKSSRPDESSAITTDTALIDGDEPVMHAMPPVSSDIPPAKSAMAVPTTRDDSSKTSLDVFNKTASQLQKDSVDLAAQASPGLTAAQPNSSSNEASETVTNVVGNDSKQTTLPDRTIQQVKSILVGSSPSELKHHPSESTASISDIEFRDRSTTPGSAVPPRSIMEPAQLVVPRTSISGLQDLNARPAHNSHLSLWLGRDPTDPYEPFFVTDDNAYFAKANRSYLLRRRTKSTTRKNYMGFRNLHGASVSLRFPDAPDLDSMDYRERTFQSVIPAKRARDDVDDGASLSGKNLTLAKLLNVGGVEAEPCDKKYIQAVKAASAFNAAMESRRKDIRDWYAEDEFASRISNPKEAAAAEDESTSTS